MIYTQDITKIKGIDCQNIKINTKKNYLSLSKFPYLSDVTKKIGLPLTNKDPSCFLDGVDDNSIEEYFLSHLYISVIDFSKSVLGEIVINVNHNEILNKKIEKNIIPFSNNIMIIYIDSVSRANSIRQLKKTLKFFENLFLIKRDFMKDIQQKISIVFNFLNIIHL